MILSKLFHSRHHYRRILAILSGNYRAQKILERIVDKAQFLMGVGSGSGVDVSGERVVLEMVQQLKKTSFCIFDVGSNKGQYITMAMRVFEGLNVHIHAFEPSTATYDLLCNSVPNSQKITLNNMALGKETGTFELFYDRTGSGLASLSKRKLDHFGITFNLSEQCNVDTLDNYCERNHINHIDVLKLDVEGHELDVLWGANHMFQEKAIDIVAFEFGGCNIDSRTFFQDYYYFFNEHAMKIFRITPSGYLMPLPHYREIDEQFRTTNFVAIKGKLI